MPTVSPHCHVTQVSILLHDVVWRCDKQNCDPQSLIMMSIMKTIMLFECRVIGEALERKGNAQAHPSDYLNFYCLANRQKPSGANIKRNSGAEKAGAQPDKSFIHIHAKVSACVVKKSIIHSIGYDPHGAQQPAIEVMFGVSLIHLLAHVSHLIAKLDACIVSV